MKTISKAGRYSISLWLLLSFTLMGCNAYISKDAQKRFEACEEPFSVTVFPVNVVTGGTMTHDEDLAIEVMQFLRQEQLAVAELGATEIEIPVRWHPDQTKMVKESALAFASAMQTLDIETDYALLVEILCNHDESKVKGVHYYLSDKAGGLADGALRNSHWEEFHEVQPHDRQGGCEVAKLMLRNEWRGD